MSFQINLHKSYGVLLESTAVRILPTELVKALSELDQHKRADEMMTSLCQAAWEQYTIPLVSKHTPITDVERQGLEYVKELFKSRLGYNKERRELEKQVLELLGKYRIGR